MPMMAQEKKQPRFNPEEFKAKMEAYITEKAELSKEEAEKVLPIFSEMKSKQYELTKQERKLRRQGEKEFTSDKDFEEALDKMAELKENAADLEEDYYKKMCKAISARKVYAIKLADDAFHREMLQRSNGHQRHRPDGHNRPNHPNRPSKK